MLCLLFGVSGMSAQKTLSYVALELDEASHERVAVWAENHLPWTTDKILAHHMTIVHHTGLRTTMDDPDVAANDHVLAWAMAHEGETFDLTVSEVGVSDKAFALLVSDADVPSRNRMRHITLATNPATGGKAVDSNYITQWQPLQEPMKLKGKVTFFYK